MRSLRILVLASLIGLLAAPVAGAHVLHTVAAGETLWSIAAASNLTTRTVAVYNGLAPDAHVVLGSTLKIPSVAEGAAALAGAGVVPAAQPAGAPLSASASAPASAMATAAAPASTSGPATIAVTPAGAPPPQGAYVVRPGDTLSALAAQTGVSVAQMAGMNGLDPAGLLLVGTVLKLPNGAPAPARASLPAPAARVIPVAAPLPTAGRVSAERVRQLGAQQGVPGSLAAAIAWQESGFNNRLVSTANARGVMQVMPGTWDWVQRNLGVGPLSPTSAEDNVRAGSAYLASLLRATGGDVRLATAGYYQGLFSVRMRGMYDDTRRYVDNVLALRARFGG
jgi:soluble lytic murein transglycosylase-like protein